MAGLIFLGLASGTLQAGDWRSWFAETLGVNKPRHLLKDPIILEYHEKPTSILQTLLKVIPPLFSVYLQSLDQGGVSEILSNAWGNKHYVRNVKSSFADIAGKIPEDIENLKKLLSNRESLRDLGATIPKGILMYGPPGTGKTSIARALAGEIQDCAFFSVPAPEFFASKWQGDGIKKLKEFFFSVKRSLNDIPRYKQAIVFIDELDAFSSRDSGSDNEDNKRTLQCLLDTLDGFQKDGGKPVIIIGATNRVDALDDALTRPGRFDYTVKVPLPDEDSRLDAIKHYAKKHKLNNFFDKNFFYKSFAQYTQGFSYADIKQVFNDSAIQAAVDDCVSISQTEFFHSFLKRYATLHNQGRQNLYQSRQEEEENVQFGDAMTIERMTIVDEENQKKIKEIQQKFDNAKQKAQQDESEFWANIQRDKDNLLALQVRRGQIKNDQVKNKKAFRGFDF